MHAATEAGNSNVRQSPCALPSSSGVRQCHVWGPDSSCMPEGGHHACAFSAVACRMEAMDNCQLDILLLYEVVADDVMTVMFPINSMRNYALLQARTPLVAMVDVDLIVSNALLQWLLDKQK